MLFLLLAAFPRPMEVLTEQHNPLREDDRECQKKEFLPEGSSLLAVVHRIVTVPPCAGLMITVER